MEETDKLVEQGLLYDFYGGLLTKHQQKIYEEAVYENLSLSEIADLEQISRQAVSDLLHRTTAALQHYEEELGLIRRFEHIRQLTGELRELASQESATDQVRTGVLRAADRIEQELQ